MRQRQLIVALLVGVVVALAVYESGQLRIREEEGVSVVVAARDLPARSVLAGDDLRRVTVPRRTLPAGAVAEVAEAVGQVLRDPLYTGEFVDARHLALRATELSASVLIPANKDYAFNLPMSLFLAPPPRLQMHDRIDIVGYPRGQPLEKGGVIVADLEIIDLSPEAKENASGTTYLTVGANADDIVRILAARDQYILGLALRPYARPAR